MTTTLKRTANIIAVLAIGLLSACGGGSGNSSSSNAVPVSAQVSGSTPFSSSCGSTAPGGESFAAGSAVQPQIAAIPGGALVGAWEQDRWSGPGARAILTARSLDAGATWNAAMVLPFSNCGGGNGPGASYDRASDPWVSFAGNGVVYASALAFSANGFLATGGLSAVLVARSIDSGATWGTPVVAKAEPTNTGTTGPFFFNDRDSIASDSIGNVYLVWDRITSDGTASIPAWLATPVNGGPSWNARVMYDPGPGNQSFNNEIAILPNGTVVDVFTLLSRSNLTTGSLQLIKSSDQGATWSATTKIANITPVGTTNPIPGGMAIRDSSLMAQIAVDSASGNVAVVWQQSFGSATFDGIALSVSKDGGSTWSTTPMQINGVKTVAAFNPSVRYLPGSVLAVTYYDFRDFVTGSSTLSTSAWLTESSDGGATWRELRLQSPFDLNKAPLTDQPNTFLTALFLGDNQGLALAGSSALPFYAATSGTGAHVYATQAPSPLTLATAHAYQAAGMNGALPAAAAARAAINAQQVMSRLRAGPVPR